ncbi:glycosyltransferase family 2 protein [Flavobacterium luminosum]|uniref:Glycosyltransferase family 2 protein n=1 Tax=Flavobacterium luminosum TaxID=2949086 RepID=A0ABT0TN49_9FLAO|nr:glycosyltransferase family 2 protein [Flavobacterium sp. HXWNR70]MCL9808514.1 glycosyltransferase family 2 protein [Flavobacterium sp. HXWNR70]
MPFFSVIIPLYNKEKFIRKTLTNVLKQSFQNFEIIVVNDGSTDNSLLEVEPLKDPRIKIFNQENKGAASARNFGVEAATGEVIAFLDADDLWLENHLEELYNLYNDFPDCGLYCSRYLIQLSEKNIFQPSFSYAIANQFRGIIPDFFEASLVYRVALTSALCIPKKIIRNNSFNTKVSSGQDLELFTKIAIEYPVAITNIMTVEYNFSIENQLSKTPIIKKTLPDLKQFDEKEKKNKSLKRFLDNYRKEYALHYKIAGDSKTSHDFYSTIHPENISFKFKVIYFLPRIILINLLRFKRFLNKKGLEFTIYN